MSNLISHEVERQLRELWRAYQSGQFVPSAKGIRRSPQRNMTTIGKADGAIAARSGATVTSGTVSLWKDNSGTLEDSTVDVTAFNKTETALTAGDYVDVWQDRWGTWFCGPLGGSGGSSGGWILATADEAFTTADTSFDANLDEKHFLSSGNSDAVNDTVTIKNTQGIFNGAINDKLIALEREDGDYELIQKPC